ncbi:hypothetical protein [Burkholderia sp. BE17]|uniref:hypothetical protein n=1 Tax=Burkholderia sp. BE17 TaxID=2656644 RepID=UPI00128BB235|nr:hypothetical protein [Burkholderia sp. BE17]MPV65554.1 hypothetical protein [Burkholderia sp. BE17]
MPLTTADFSVQSDAEREVRAVLAKYKLGLVQTHYRNWWHRLSCWCRNKDAMRSENALAKVEADARQVVNRSAEHQSWVRHISSQQPHDVRQKDKFLSLLN